MSKSEDLTKGSLLTKNTFFSLLAQFITIIVAIISIPILIESLGVEGFGILTIAWLITGYFGMLDLGVGRALTKILSEKLGREELDDIAENIWTALILCLVLGLIGLCLLASISPYLVNNIFIIESFSVDDIEVSLYLLALAVPVIILSAALSGILQSYQRFDLVNIIRAPAGSFIFLGPVIALSFSEDITIVILSLVITRFIECVMYFIFCIRIVPQIMNGIKPKKSLFGQFIRFGSWMTISNILGPILIYLDRFLIASVISVSAVSFYATSHEIIQRLMILPGAIVGVVFPALGALLGRNDTKEASLLLFKGVKFTYIAITPIIIILYIFAEEGLNLWLGPEFSSQGSTILKTLSIGALIASLSYFPFALLHSAGRPDKTAILHVIEVPIYICLAWVLITKFGIQGAAFAWVIRVFFDTMALFIMARSELNFNLQVKNVLEAVAIVLMVLFISELIPQYIYSQLIYCIIILSFVLLYFWNRILNLDERDDIIIFTKKLILFKNKNYQ